MVERSSRDEIDEVGQDEVRTLHPLVDVEGAGAHAAALGSTLLRVFVTVLLLASLVTPIGAQVLAESSRGRAYTLTSERIAASFAALIATIGAVVGSLAVARSARRRAGRANRRAGMAAVVLGPIGIIAGGFILATADGGLGTGNGVGGAAVALMVGLIAVALGLLALVRSRPPV